MYHEKFPELESLIINPLDYVKCVKKIKNEMVSKMCERFASDDYKID